MIVMGFVELFTKRTSNGIVVELDRLIMKWKDSKRVKEKRSK